MVCSLLLEVVLFLFGRGGPICVFVRCVVEVVRYSVFVRCVVEVVRYSVFVRCRGGSRGGPI